MGIGPMTFSLRERRSATELNRPAYHTSYMLCFYVILPFFNIRKVPWCRGSIQDFGSWDPSSILGGTTFLSFLKIFSFSFSFFLFFYVCNISLPFFYSIFFLFLFSFFFILKNV